MGARNGVTAALMVQAEFTGVPDTLDGEHNAKTFSVGFPIQAALDAFFTLQRENSLTVSNVDRIVVRLPEDSAAIVDNCAMPDVNCQCLIAVALIDGALSFDASYSYARMKDAQLLAVKARVQLVADRALMDPAAPRSLMVPVLGATRTEALIQRLNTLEQLRSVRELMPLLAR